MAIGVYQIRNKNNGKFYVGSSAKIKARLERHKRDLVKGEHHCIYLQRAYDKYGADSFEFITVQLCSTESEAREIEQKYLDSYDGYLYNTSRVAGGGNLISYHPNRDKIINKMKISLNKRYESMTEEERKVIYGSHENGMKGRSHTKESKIKIGIKQIGNSYAKGVIRTPEHRAKLSKIASQRTGEKNHFYGKKHSEETKQKLSEKMKGKLPPNTKPVMIDNVQYLSASEASRKLGVTTATVINRIKSSKFPTYQYLDS